MALFFVILAMGAVTFIPRLLPVFIVDRLNLPDWVNRWLKAIPYAALGALIFPGILYIEEGSPFTGLAGGAAAVILAALRVHILFVIFGAMAAVLIMKVVTG